MSLDWNHPVRVLIQIADAPAHGNIFHDSSMDDSRGDFDPDGKIMKGLLQRVRDLGIDYFFGKIAPATDKVSYRGCVPSLE